MKGKLLWSIITTVGFCHMTSAKSGGGNTTMSCYATSLQAMFSMVPSYYQWVWGAILCIGV